jgi:hypothetical protein
MHGVWHRVALTAPPFARAGATPPRVLTLIGVGAR